MPTGPYPARGVELSVPCRLTFGWEKAGQEDLFSTTRQALSAPPTTAPQLGSRLPTLFIVTPSLVPSTLPSLTHSLTLSTQWWVRARTFQLQNAHYLQSHKILTRVSNSVARGPPFVPSLTWLPLVPSEGSWVRVWVCFSLRMALVTVQKKTVPNSPVFLGSLGIQEGIRGVQGDLPCRQWFKGGNPGQSVPGSYEVTSVTLWAQLPHPTAISTPRFRGGRGQRGEEECQQGSE